MFCHKRFSQTATRFGVSGDKIIFLDYDIFTTSAFAEIKNVFATFSAFFNKFKPSKFFLHGCLENKNAQAGSAGLTPST